MKNMIRISFVLLIAFSSPVFAGTDQGASENAADKIRVLNSATTHSSGENSRNMITTIGNLKNNSTVGVENITVEVKYYDSQKSLIDTVTQNLSSIVIPPSKEVSFRVRCVADKPKELYVSHEVRIIDAEQMERRQTRRQKSVLTDILLSWLPMILLIAVWIFSMRKVGGGNQKKLIEITERQNQILERLAIAAEKNLDRSADTNKTN